MAERATVFQVVQVGVESTYGTAPASGYKRLQSMGISPSIKTSVKTFRPVGTKFNAIASQGKEWGEAKVDGVPSYTELQYALCSILNNSAPALSGATYTWTLTPSAAAADTPSSFTVEQGSSIRAGKFTGGVFNSFGMAWTRDDVSMNGSLLGLLYQDGITMKSGGAVTTITDQQPLQPKELSVYLADTYAGLPGTALARVLGVSFDISDRWVPLWVLDAAQTSFVAVVEQAPKASFKLKMEADAEGMGILTALRAGSSKFMRIKSVSPTQTEAGKYYTLQLDACLKCVDVSEFADEQGVFAIEWSFDLAYDATWTKAIEAILLNKQSAL